jgi:hypothetical protein
MALSVSAVYNDDYGRVQVSFTGANTDADYAKVEWSKDQITWTTIRGGDAVPVSAGAGKVDHYDGYIFGITNYYRVTAIDSAPVTNVGSGTFTTGNNATIAPPLPAGLSAGNMMVLKVSHRNTAATITTPTGWTRVASGSGHFEHFYRPYQAGDTAPSVAFSGGSAGDSCSGQVHAWVNAQAPVHVATSVNSSAQDVVYPGGTSPTKNTVWFMDAWKQSAGTSGAGAPPSFIDQQGAANTAGANGETHLSWRTDYTSNLNSFTTGVSLWSGGSAAISKARLLRVPPRDFTDQATTSYTPVFPNANSKPYWLMNPSRPGQNIRVEITGFPELSQGGRTGIFEIVGRSAPVIVSDIMESISFEFTLDAANKTEAKEIAARIALGDPMYLLVPDLNADIDTLYFTATNLKRAVDTPGGSWSVTVSARQVSQPAPAVYGSTYIWSDVPTNYATWTDVVAGVATWSNLVDKVSNSVIIVP